MLNFENTEKYILTVQMYRNNEEGITELIPSGPVLQCLSLHMEDSHLEVVPGATIVGRQLGQEVTHGQLLPGGRALPLAKEPGM